MEFSDLKFVRINNPGTSPEIIDMVFRRIPRELFEQIPDREWEVGKLYEWKTAFLSNPLNLFWVLIDAEAIIKGVLWATIDPVLEMMAVNILSVDKEYQHPRGEAIVKSIEHLKRFRSNLKKDSGFELKDKILWTTTRPEAFERAGMNRNNRTIMEASLA